MKELLRSTALSLFIVAGAISASPALAQQQDGGAVREIVVQGTQRVEPETVRSYMAIAEGDAFDARRIDQSLKSLFATGLFADVTLRREGDRLVVSVVENPIINRIAFEGNKKLKDDALTSEVQLRPRVVYTRTKVQNDVKRVLDLYRRSGRFAATVEPKIIQLEQNRVDLVFEINEGPATYVSGINFVGNRAFSDSKLREILRTKESRWYRFFTSDDTYDPDRLTYDRELLRRHYLKGGYADFSVVSAVAELTPNRESFIVTFTIEEGERYKVGKTDVRTSLVDLDVGELAGLVATEEGDWYSAEEAEDTVQRMTDAVGNRGYAFVDVRPRIERNREERTVAITYDIEEGPRVFVERIDINGNVRTLDKVVRREFRLVEGDAFNTAKLRRSRQRIRDLNFFEKVEVDNVPSETAPDRTVIKVDVEEKSTGELSFGVGWSTSNGALFDISARERNLLGRGQDLRIGAMLAQRQTQFDFSFTEPYFLERNVVVGFDAFAVTTELQEESSYDADSVGGALRTGYQISEFLRQDLRYTLRSDEIRNVSPYASRYIRDQAGNSVVSSVAQTLTYDKRDSRVDPTEGYFVRLGTELAGVGGTERFVRLTGGGGYYYPLADEFVLGATLNGGYILGLEDPVRINNRFFLGGDSMRGFRTAGISPRDRGGNADALGGMWMYSGSVQLNAPLGLPEELGLRGKIFTDFGAVGPTDDSVRSIDVYQSNTIRMSAGVGVTWRSPMGPINIDLGFPIIQESFDETENLRFNFGTRF